MGGGGEGREEGNGLFILFAYMYTQAILSFLSGLDSCPHGDREAFCMKMRIEYHQDVVSPGTVFRVREGDKFARMGQGGVQWWLVVGIAAKGCCLAGGR